ncbi:hypothetical protein M3Y99_00607200 [Aphelenchoides fujianensis]|nr:hypothetical protein M3Y99_00607200 [Aphelenchoides fujianensis]
MSDRELSALSELDVLDEVGEMSFYEDALDFSDDDLKQLCSDTERHLRFTEESQTKYVLRWLLIQSFVLLEGMLGNRYRRFQSTESIPVASSSPKPARPQQSSSSGDNSSIERISSGPQSRSRQSTSQPRRRTAQRSDGSSNGNNDGWKVVNPLDYSCTPMLFQIDKQLQLISMQLRETQLSNSLAAKTHVPDDQILHFFEEKIVDKRRRSVFGVGIDVHLSPRDSTPLLVVQKASPHSSAPHSPGFL